MVLSASIAVPAEENGSGAYRPYEGIIRGTEGAGRVQLEIRNVGPGDLICSASLAHWYSEPLGRVASGRVLDVTLWHVPQTGVLNRLNAVGDRMPVEAVWCGTPDTDQGARGRVELPFIAGPIPARLLRSCAVEAGGIVCRPDGE